MKCLQRARVAIVGVGGVGGYAVEALARAGVGYLFLVDAAVFDPSNLNRQILALRNTVGRSKVDVARERVMQINPAAVVETRQLTLTPENVADVLPMEIQYAVDAIDDVPAKLQLILTLYRRGVYSISCMGAGSKLRPADFRVADIGDTRGCPLARRIRQRLRKEGIYRGVRCVYGTENMKAVAEKELSRESKRALGTISYMPGLAGLTAAGVIINDILDSSERLVESKRADGQKNEAHDAQHGRRVPQIGKPRPANNNAAQNPDEIRHGDDLPDGIDDCRH